MKEIILRESEYAQKVLSSGDFGNAPSFTMMIMAKYLRTQGYENKEIAKKIEETALKSDPYIIKDRFRSIIDMYVKKSEGYNLVDVEGVIITEKELSDIALIEGDMRKKLMFTLLCLAKYGNILSTKNDNWVNKPDKDIFALANIKVTVKRQSLLLNDLWRLGFIKYGRAVDNTNINVTIVDTESKEGILISDFRNLGNQYMMNIYTDYIRCQDCGIVIHKSCNAQKYCRECAKKKVTRNKRDN